MFTTASKAPIVGALPLCRRHFQVVFAHFFNKQIKSLLIVNMMEEFNTFVDKKKRLSIAEDHSLLVCVIK